MAPNGAQGQVMREPHGNSPDYLYAGNGQQEQNGNGAPVDRNYLFGDLHAEHISAANRNESAGCLAW